MNSKPGKFLEANAGDGCYPYAQPGGLPFSLHYHDIARWLFIVLIFAGLLSSGWFGIPLVPKYFVGAEIDLVIELFVLFSALGTIWGVMAYREFSKSASAVIEARLAARKLDPMIGDYEYKSYNPVTKEYENGFVPSGPVDFWDKETHVPSWLDKGKYWHILLTLQSVNREIKLQVVRDKDLPFGEGPRNVAVTYRERVSGEIRSRRYQYVVKVPQWLVMNTERQRFVESSMDSADLSSLISDVNRKIVLATNEVAGWERLRVRYPWRFMTFVIYLNKSLPLRIVYYQVIRNFPGAKKRRVEQTNADLANVSDEELVASIMELAVKKGIPADRLSNLRALVKFLKNSYTRQGLGEGSSEYHNFHHSLEVSYMAMHMLPPELEGYTFDSKDYELILVAGLLHDYDPMQAPTQQMASTSRIKGPSVVRTMQELQRIRLHDAYFTMAPEEFENYFREFKSVTTPPEEFATTHPEYVKAEWTPTDSLLVEALIWRTDFPYFKQKIAQEKFASLLEELKTRGRQDSGKIKLLSEVLWLADLSVTYMGSDPIRAWDRVINLYDELYLPKLEAVSRTDAFFADFADIELFKRLISQKAFPDVFRQRWNLIYQFFHEGNPSTPLNRTIETARKMYFKVNVELGMRRGEMLQAIASDNWSEYFIGIGKDQDEVFKAKSRLAELDPQNASAFWGDFQKLLPSINDKSIDNFLLVMPEHSTPLTEQEYRNSLQSMLATMSKKLAQGGMVKILTDIDKNSAHFRELMTVADQAGLVAELKNVGKTYFPKNWRDRDFVADRQPHVITLVLRAVAGGKPMDAQKDLANA